jgi:hypothetical protein
VRGRDGGETTEKEDALLPVMGNRELMWRAAVPLLLTAIAAVVEEPTATLPKDKV